MQPEAREFCAQPMREKYLKSRDKADSEPHCGY